MTLAGLTLAIGPMIDSAIICLENTHRHLGMGATTHEAAFLGASEVAMPELVSTLCTFLVLAPLVLHARHGQFLFKPMAMAVAFAMIAAYILSRTLVPACSAFWLKPHGPGHGAGAQGAEAQGGHAPEPHATSAAEPQTFQINGNGNGHSDAGPSRQEWCDSASVRALGADDRERHRLLRQGRSTACCRHPFLTIGVAFGAAGSDAAS